MTTNCDRNTRRIDVSQGGPISGPSLIGSWGKNVTVTDAAPASALATQVSGDHYRNAKIQPIEFIHANNIPFCEANVIKYVFRWKTKNGVKDLEKAKHYIDLLIELESKNV